MESASTHARPIHRWAADRRGQVRFALKIETHPDDPSPTATGQAAGRLADELGYDAFLMSDHPTWQPDPWVHLAALAMTTRQIGLGPMVSCVLYRPPVVTARLAADVDHHSAGRLVLGLGIGWDAAALGWGTNEFDRMGLHYPKTRERQEALTETIAILRGLWGAEPFTFQGRHFTTMDAQVAPPPVHGMPPIVIAGAGDRTLRQVAEFADAGNFGPAVTGGVDSPDAAREKLAVLRRHCDVVGRSFDDILKTHFTIWLILAEDDEAVRRKVDRYFPHGLDGTWQRAVVAGTPDRVIPCFQAYADIGMDYFIVQTLDARDEETIHLLAAAISPKVVPGPRQHVEQP